MQGTYFRWTLRHGGQGKDVYVADILASETAISAIPSTGMVMAEVPDRPISPDEARMIGVRLIEAAVLADNARSIREP